MTKKTKDLDEKTNNNHHIIIRHFKTKNDKLNYSKSYDEAVPYINFLKSYIEKYNINEVIIYTSSYERTLMTSLILYIELKEILNYKIHIQKPLLSKYLERQTNKFKQQSIVNHFKSDYNTKGKLIINITHSSIYLKVFHGLLQGMNSEDLDINKLVDNIHIHSHSLSFLTDISSEVKYGFNIKME